MSDFLQQRLLYLNSKKKQLGKNMLPQIKYSPIFPKKTFQDLVISPDGSRIISNVQPLSNILISRKITPSSQEETMLIVTRKRMVPSGNVHNFKIRKDSVKRIKQRQTEQKPSKRKSTSMSHRLPSCSNENQQILLSEQVKANKLIKPEQLTFSVVRGNNNEELVRDIMLDRKIWKEIKFGEGVANFKWLFYKDRHNYKKMWSFTKKKMINHFQFNEQICTKDSLVKNLQIYCETRKIQVFTVTPVTFILDFDDQYCEYNMKQFLSFFQKYDPRQGVTKRTNLPWSFTSKFHGYMAWQNSQIKKRVNTLSRPINCNTYFSQNSYLWLLKPTGLNRGRGIQIFDSIQQLQKILMDYLMLMERKCIKQKSHQKHQKNMQKQHQKQQRNDSPMKQTKEGTLGQSLEMNQQRFQGQKFELNRCSFVIQKYVQKPFLIHSRKFDIRVWSLLTESMNIYFFKQGYIRTSAQQFSTDNIDNYFIHLTNNAIQKYSQNYGQFQNANQLSFWDLNQFMNEQQVKTIWNKIKQITYMAFSSIKKKINANQRKHCFQIFGLDFIIDSELKVWLIEVNENPCIQCSSPLLGQLIPRMLNDAFKLTIDQIVDKKCETKPYPVTGYTDGQNMWQKLGQLSPNSSYIPRK